MLFKSGVLYASFSNELAYSVPAEVSYFIKRRRFLELSFIPGQNYGVKNVEEYADRLSSYGRNKSCNR